MIHGFVNGSIEVLTGNVLGLSASWSRAPFRRSVLAPRASPEGAGWGLKAKILTSSLSRKLRPSNFSIAVLAEAGRSRAQLIETFSIILWFSF
jgi:hypothetical protein